MDIIPPAIRCNEGMAFRSIWTNIYDARGSSQELVVDEGYMACAGLSMMLGYTTHPGRGFCTTCVVCSAHAVAPDGSEACSDDAINPGPPV
eukprot:2690374-Rhodomonas_salina.1